jgi:hypothetical protein
MSLSKRIIKKYGSIRKFCDEMGINYGSFRTQMAFRKIYGKNKRALIDAGIVENERELERMLFEDTQARNLAKEA